MEALISSISGILPAGWNIPDVLICGLLLCLGILLLGWLIRLIRGKQSDLNHALSSALGIIAMYVVCALVYTFAPSGFASFLAPLPFVSFQGDTMVLLPLTQVQPIALCREILSMVILAFLANLADSWIPKGKKLLDWLLLRIMTVAVAIILHYGVTALFHALIPDVLTSNAPMILLCILAGLLLLGILKFLLGLVLTIASPILGAIYAFFFSNKLGKQLSKAVMTTVVLIVLVFLLEACGFGTICIGAVSFTACLPVVLILLLLWYLIGSIL